MTRFRNTAAALAATGLLLAQPAAAAARVGAATGDSVALADAAAPGSGPVIAILGLLGVVFLIMAISDGDDSDSPSSP